MSQPTSFSLSTGQLRQALDLVDRAEGVRNDVIGLHIVIHHAAEPVDPPVWTGQAVFSGVHGGDLLGKAIVLDGKGW